MENSEKMLVVITLSTEVWTAFCLFLGSLVGMCDSYSQSQKEYAVFSRVLTREPGGDPGRRENQTEGQNWSQFNSGPVDTVTEHVLSARLWGCRGTQDNDHDRCSPHPQTALRSGKVPGEER